MLNSIIKTHIETKLTEFYGPADFSKEIEIQSTTFEKDFPQKSNAYETKIRHIYTVIVKASVDVETNSGAFADYWEADQLELSSGGSDYVIYPDIRDYVSKKEDTTTFKAMFVLSVEYIYRRTYGS